MNRWPIISQLIISIYSTATGEEVSIFMPEDEVPTTKAGKMMAFVGIKAADKKPPNIAIGIIGIAMVTIPVAIIIVSDVNILRRHLKMMLKNVKEGWRHVKQRSAKVAPK